MLLPESPFHPHPFPSSMIFRNRPATLRPFCLVAAIALAALTLGFVNDGATGHVEAQEPAAADLSSPPAAATEDTSATESTAAAESTAAPANPPGAEDHSGHDHASGSADHSLPGVSGNPTADDQLSIEAVIKEFKEKAPPEIVEPGLASVTEFETSAAEFKAKVLEMRRQYVYFANEFTTDRETYLTLRNESRELMNRTYRNALDVISYLPHPEALRFVVTILEQREKHQVYDAETLEGAAKLLDYGVRLRYVVLGAARAAMAVGNFELADRLYEKVELDELDDEDKSLIAQKDEIKEQFEAEAELLKNDPDDLPQLRLLTSRGEIVADLFINEAPSTVANFIKLVEAGFYDGLDFFQVIDGLLALTGDPLGDGSTRPDQYIADEHLRDVKRMPLAGSLVMAKLPSQEGMFVPNTAGTQFAILFMPFPVVTKSQTVFGRVTKGWDVLGALRRVDPHKEKKKNEVLAPPDRIIHAEIINRPETLPEVIYAEPAVYIP